MKKVFLAILALTTIAVFAFTPTTSKKTAVQFKYIGTNGAAGYQTPSNWEVGTSLSSCPGNGSVVCLISPDDEEIDTVSELLLELQANDFDNMTIIDTRP